MDAATIADLCTAGGTLVLAVATFASIRSSQRAARISERSLLANLRPMLFPSLPDDREQTVSFLDDVHVLLAGGRAHAEERDGVVYAALSLRNAGAGMAVLDRWWLEPASFRPLATADPAPTHQFRRLTRDLYIPPEHVGFWQGAMRDPDDAHREHVQAAVRHREQLTLELLYGDLEGNQQTVSRFRLTPTEDGGWYAVVIRHWPLSGGAFR